MHNVVPADKIRIRKESNQPAPVGRMEHRAVAPDSPDVVNPPVAHTDLSIHKGIASSRQPTTQLIIKTFHINLRHATQFS